MKPPKGIRNEHEQNFNNNYNRSITHPCQKLSSQRIVKCNNKMRLCALVLVVLSYLLILQTSETKKIKLKDLKKLKKYAFLLAPQSKRFYAIPFPVPLPVFVKRQQIYTQIPVVPRYVHQPYYSLAPAAYADPYADSYAAHSDPAAYQSGQQEQEQEKENSNKATNSGSSSIKGKSNGVAAAASSSKYLAQLASAIGRAYPVLGVPGSQHNLVGKLLSGQAKVLPPTALLSTLKSPSYIEQQQRQEEYTSSKGAESKGSKQISAPPKLFVDPYALPIRYPALAYHPQHHHHHPDVMSAGLGYLHAAYASPHRYLQAQHLHTQSPPFHTQLAHELTVEPSSSNSQRDTHLQELQAADNQDPSAAGEYDIMVQADERQPHLQQQHQLVDALRKLRLQQAEETQAARANSYALTARHLGLPIMPGQIQLLNYQ